MAVAQEDDAVGPGSEVRLVRHDDTRDAPLRCGAQQAHDCFAVHGVERAGRLVGEQQPALADDRPGDRNALALTSRQLVGVAIGEVCHVELLHRLDASGARGFGADAVELEGQGDVLDRRQPREQVEVLEDVADRPASHPRLFRARDVREVDPVHEHLAAGRLLEAAGDRQERALAGAARAHDRDELAPLDREIDITQRAHLGRPGAVNLRNLAQFERAGHCETSIG